MAARSYRVVVAGHVGATVAEALGPLRIEVADGHTTISGDPLDAAGLAAVLDTIARLGLELVGISSDRPAGEG